MRFAMLMLTSAAVAAAMTVALAKDEPKATVKFAKSWEKAVEEAKLLNVPLVVHCHGVY